MGRFDLARQYYKAALAISPNDPALLSALAASLDSQGMRAEAAEVRAEVSQLQAASEALDAPIVPDPEPAVVQAAPVKPMVVQAAPVKPAVKVVSAPLGGSGAGRSSGAGRPDHNGQVASCAACAGGAAQRFRRRLHQLRRARRCNCLKPSVDVRSEPSQYADRIPLRAVAQAAAASVTVALPPARPVQARSFRPNQARLAHRCNCHWPRSTCVRSLRRTSYGCRPASSN